VEDRIFDAHVRAHDFKGGHPAAGDAPAFRQSPSKGEVEGQQPVTGFLGKGLVNTFDPDGDRSVGTLTSPEFDLNKKYLHFLVGGGAFEAQRMLGVDRDDVVDVGAKHQPPRALGLADLHLDGDERRVVDRDPDPLDRRHQNVTVHVLAQNRSEQLDQGRPADRRAAVEPRPVGGDAHVDFAAIGRIPKITRRRRFGQTAEGALRRAAGRHNLALVCGQRCRPYVTPCFRLGVSSI